MSMTEAEIREFNRIRIIAHRQSEEILLLRTMIASRDHIFIQIKRYLDNVNIDNILPGEICQVVKQMLNCKLSVELAVNKKAEQEQQESEEQSNVQRRLNSIED